jgi:hypothetical protein
MTPETIRMIHGITTKGDYISYGTDAIDVTEWAIKPYMDTLEACMKYKGVVEGAAHNKPYGQTGLAYIRFGFYLGLHQNGVRVTIKPPASIRKVAFGNGDEDGGYFFPRLNGNGVASLGCCLYGIGYRCPKSSTTS